jgi:hypothetical protein
MKKIKGVSNNGVDFEKLNTAYDLLQRSFSNPIRNTYFRGKTEFRDFLYEKMECSLLEAEIIVDALEKNGRVEFRRFRKGMRYGTWEIHGKT